MECALPSGRLYAIEAGQRMVQAHLEGEGAESMRNQYEARPHGDDGLPTWRPQPGEVLAGVFDRYTISDTPQGLVRTVIVTEARTAARVRLWLASTILLSLFAQHQPHPGERIAVRYRWRDLDNGYHRWMLVVDRPEALDFSPWGGKCLTRCPGTGRGAWPSPSQDSRLAPRRPYEPDHPAALDARGPRSLGDPWHR
jgi:hypothetical protein